MSLRVVFAGTPDFSVPTLQALIESDYEVVAVYTQPDRRRGRGKKVQFSPVKTLAVEHDIPVIQPESLRNEEAQAEFRALNADLMVVVAYGLILPVEILNAPTYGCLNIHASLLPRWRGAAPLHRAIESGDSETGVAIMQMDKGLDTGDIWSESKMAITPQLTTGELHDQLEKMGAELLLETIPRVISGKEKPTPQDEAGVTYAEKIEREEAEINWENDAVTIIRKVHAFNPIPGAFTHHDETLIKIYNMALTNEASDQKAGTLRVEENRLYVTSGDQQWIEILMIQSAGRRRMETAQFLQGNDLNGEVFQ